LYANANAFVAWIHLLSLLAILAIILNDHPACHCWGKLVLVFVLSAVTSRMSDCYNGQYRKENTLHATNESATAFSIVFGTRPLKGLQHAHVRSDIAADKSCAHPPVKEDSKPLAFSLLDFLLCLPSAAGAPFPEPALAKTLIGTAAAALEAVWCAAGCCACCACCDPAFSSASLTSSASVMPTGLCGASWGVSIWPDASLSKELALPLVCILLSDTILSIPTVLWSLELKLSGGWVTA